MRTTSRGGPPSGASSSVDFHSEDRSLRSDDDDDDEIGSESLVAPEYPSIQLVDDGSIDATIEVVENFKAKIPIRTVALEENGGKGAALAKGVRAISESVSTPVGGGGDTLVLTQDADGSGDLVYLDTMLNTLRKLLDCDGAAAARPTPTTTPGGRNNAGRGLVIGNRNYELFSPRGITRWGFQTCVRILTSNTLRVKDSQCGYKLMTLNTAEALYRNLHLKGWSHDVEVLFKASLLNIPIDEISIDWQDKDGSKITETGIVKVSLQMLWDVIRLRWNYSIVKSWKLDS